MRKLFLITNLLVLLFFATGGHSRNNPFSVQHNITHLTHLGFTEFSMKTISLRLQELIKEMEEKKPPATIWRSWSKLEKYIDNIFWQIDVYNRDCIPTKKNTTLINNFLNFRHEAWSVLNDNDLTLFYGMDTTYYLKGIERITKLNDTLTVKMNLLIENIKKYNELKFSESEYKKNHLTTHYEQIGFVYGQKIYIDGMISDFHKGLISDDEGDRKNRLRPMFIEDWRKVMKEIDKLVLVNHVYYLDCITNKKTASPKEDIYKFLMEIRDFLNGEKGGWIEIENNILEQKFTETAELVSQMKTKIIPLMDSLELSSEGYYEKIK